MRILVLTFYYPPDLSAGSFRAGALVAALRERAPPGTQIDVVTTAPNRYQTFALEASAQELEAGLSIVRVPLPTHNSDMPGQSCAFVQFARGALAAVAHRDYDLVFATSSRLMTAALGSWIARRKRTALYLDIRDIFADTIPDVLPTPAGWLARGVFSMLESWTIRRADRVNLVSPGFESYFRQRYGERSYSLFTNGIDDEFLAVAPGQRPPSKADEPPLILYAGNIGEGQGLHEILPGLARALSGRARFVVIGDGGRRASLESAIRNAGVVNVEIRSPMPRSQLLEEYRRANVLFLHLGDRRAFEKVLPSKLFEYAALGKPVLAGVAGYAARFVREEISNAAVFSPCDVGGAVKAFESLELSDGVRSEFVAKYARTGIARAMAEDLLSVGRRR